MQSPKTKRKALMIFSKDMDAHLAYYMHSQYEVDVDVVFWRHRDKLEFEKKYDKYSNLHSIPQYLHERMHSFLDMEHSDIVDRLEAYRVDYKLRCGNRYIHYDFYRGRKKNDSYRENLIKNLLFIEFFLGLRLDSYDFIIGELSRSYCLICYDLSKYFNVHYLHPVNLGFFDGIAFVDDKFKIEYFDEKCKRLKADEKVFDTYKTLSSELIKKFRDKPSYGKSFLKPRLSVNTKVFRRFLGKLSNLGLEYSARKYDKEFYVGNVYVNPIIRFFEGGIKRQIKLLINRFWIGREKNGKIKGDYIYYPLHVHPETTTSLYSERTINNFGVQIDNIYYLSKFVPISTSVVVKEHPAMIAQRDGSYYKNIRSLYNVSLVSDETSQFDLIKNSKVILTHCGTVGLEGLLLGKPVITLESCYYDFMEGVQNIRTLSDIDDALKKAYSYTQSYTSMVEGVAFLLYAQYPGVKNFSIDHYPEGVSKNNLSVFCDAIFNELNFRNEQKIN